jgi:hypothetical protein
MSHRHFCDYAGHEWECEGTALRPIRGDTEPSMCMCLNHQVSMEDGDHSMCSIELLACPEHREEQLREMGTLGRSDRPDEECASEAFMFHDEEGNPIIGFCLWCNKDFYSMEEVEDHNTDELKACPVYQQWKEER